VSVELGAVFAFVLALLVGAVLLAGIGWLVLLVLPARWFGPTCEPPRSRWYEGNLPSWLAVEDALAEHRLRSLRSWLDEIPRV
jgi:hypothetical protein